MHYDARNFSWGSELELSDVPRSLKIPRNLGAWEFAERDVVNTLPPYKNVAADPLGIEPPVGGEINIRPTKTRVAQVTKIKKVINLFSSPNVGCLMAFHVHVGIPRLVDDIDGLRRLTRYIGDNQCDVVRYCVQYVEHPLMKNTRTARRYLKFDLGRTMPNWMVDNVVTARDFQDFIRLQCCGKDGVSRGRPFRYCVNTYCLKHLGTVEFRCFRASLDLEEIRDCFRFVRDFMVSALNGGATVQILIDTNKYRFPPFWYDHDQYVGWENTKYGEGRGKKSRVRIEVCN